MEFSKLMKHVAGLALALALVPSNATAMDKASNEKELTRLKDEITKLQKELASQPTIETLNLNLTEATNALSSIDKTTLPDVYAAKETEVNGLQQQVNAKNFIQSEIQRLNGIQTVTQQLQLAYEKLETAENNSKKAADALKNIKETDKTAIDAAKAEAKTANDALKTVQDDLLKAQQALNAKQPQTKKSIFKKLYPSEIANRFTTTPKYNKVAKYTIGGIYTLVLAGGISKVIKSLVINPIFKNRVFLAVINKEKLTPEELQTLLTAEAMNQEVADLMENFNKQSEKEVRTEIAVRLAQIANEYQTLKNKLSLIFNKYKVKAIQEAARAA